MREFSLEARLIYSKSGMPNYKRYLDEMPGVPLQDLWGDIKPIGSQAAERLGYPTQKPIPLLDRIIQASSNEGDTILDPFCGCGTTIAAAQKLNRSWIGIDITQLAISLIRYRLGDSFGKDCRFEVIGRTDQPSGYQRSSEAGPLSIPGGGLSGWSEPDPPMRRKGPTGALTVGSTSMTRGKTERQSRSSSR